MRKKIFIRTLCCLFVAIMACGTAMAQNRQPLRAPAYKGPMMTMPTPEAPDVVPFYSNLNIAVPNSCTQCSYNSSNGFLVLGPTNCFSPGATQWLAYPFLASRTGNVRRVQLAVTQFGMCGGGTQFTVSIYDDACPSTGAPNTLLASKAVNAPTAPCLLATANFGTTGPVLTAGKIYWVVVTTASPTQDTFTGVWWFANSAPEDVNFNDGSGWLFFGGAGGFQVL
jgi:hypothetical protein